MASNIVSEYRSLVQKFIDGTATSEELQTLDEYYYSFGDMGSITDRLSTNELDELRDSLKGRIDMGRQITNPVRPIYRRVWFQVAASILLISSVLFTIYNGKRQVTEIKSLQIAVNTDNKVNRFINLSDGSRIILHAGSTLQVDSAFNKNNRNVSLIGEAYFDIKHDDRRKFIVKAGRITTTVLGTAFNIKAYPSDKNVTVTVTRGRVRVEKDGQTLAVLTPNKQLITLNGIKKSIEDVQAINSLKWASADMRFNAISFGKLAEHLDERYGIHIVFKNADLMSCPITGSFKGTESLKEMLDNISLTRNTTYTIKGREVEIDGPGCQ